MKTFSYPEGEWIYYERLCCQAACNVHQEGCADRLLANLQDEIHWQQDRITLFGKTHPLPRLTAWYGDPGATYTYSGIAMAPRPWTSTLLQLKAIIEPIAATSFNSVLLNLYRTGRDSMGWHSDDEPELGQNPVIASVSLGGTRRFLLRHKTRRDLDPVEFHLSHGSLLIMQGETQHYWQHQVPKTVRSVEPRINLTFRQIKLQGINVR